MKITAMITTHPARLEQATDLAHAVNGVRIIDEHEHGASWCHDKALAEGIRIHGDNDGWILICEDDAIPCNDWHNQINQALTVAPTKIVSLYLGTNYPTRRQPEIKRLTQIDTHWILHHELRHAVAYAIRADIAPRIHRTVTHLHGEADKRLSLAAQQWWEPIAYSNPSLCDHADGAPLVTHTANGAPRTRSRPRVAHTHGTRDTWTNSTVRLP